MASVTFKLPDELRKALEDAAEKEGRSLSDYVRRHFIKILPARKRSPLRKGSRP
jgi:predicted transcriptional regulator